MVLRARRIPHPYLLLIYATKPGLKEFVPNKEEKKKMAKWKEKSFEKMLDDAVEGDPAALYMVGCCFLYGLNELPINMQSAYSFFAASASLGFSPAIAEVMRSCLDKGGWENGDNPFLALVYTNLVASSGHTEYTMPYHQVRNQLNEKAGPSLFEEIERLALEKKLAIENHQEALEKISDSEKRREYIVGNLIVNGGIVEEDVNYGKEYWYSVYSK